MKTQSGVDEKYMAHIKKLIMIDRCNNHPSTTFCLITVFGPLLAVLYIGQTYLDFRNSARIHAFITHVDQLV